MDENKKTEMETQTTELMETETEEDISLVIKLKKPLVFEGKTYEKIDLTPLENITTADLVAVNRLIGSGTFGRTQMNPEFSLEYACYLAARATQQPVELFMALRPGDGLRVKNRVLSFFYR